MVSLFVGAEEVRIPDWVRDHESFRRWAHSDEFPETGRICYLNGEVWVDMSKEQLFSHNQVKGEFAFVLTGLVKAGKLGRFFGDGMLLSNEQAKFTSQPDGGFSFTATFRENRLRLVEGAGEGFVELEGTPDMVLEVISPSSVRKDMVTLRELYWRAGIPEYWLVDARGRDPEFTIFRHKPKAYAAAPSRGGWVKSMVFGKSFRRTQQADELGHPEYTLSVR